MRRTAGEHNYNMGNGLHVLMRAPTACVTDAITSRHRGYYACSPTVHWPAPANDWEQPTTSEFDSLVVGCCLAMIFYSHSHHVTHVVTESLQCRVTWNFYSLKFVINFAYFQIPFLTLVRDRHR